MHTVSTCLPIYLFIYHLPADHLGDLLGSAFPPISMRYFKNYWICYRCFTRDTCSHLFHYLNIYLNYTVHVIDVSILDPSVVNPMHNPCLTHAYLSSSCFTGLGLFVLLVFQPSNSFTESNFCSLIYALLFFLNVKISSFS